LKELRVTETVHQVVGEMSEGTDSLYVMFDIIPLPVNVLSLIEAGIMNDLSVIKYCLSV